MAFTMAVFPTSKLPAGSYGLSGSLGKERFITATKYIGGWGEEGVVRMILLDP